MSTEYEVHDIKNKRVLDLGKFFIDIHRADLDEVRAAGVDAFLLRYCDNTMFATTVWQFLESSDWQSKVYSEHDLSEYDPEHVEAATWPRMELPYANSVTARVSK